MAAGAAHELADTGSEPIEHRLPGEHGFRFFPGFYKHVIDTMRRIPSFDGRPVAEHLVDDPGRHHAVRQADLRCAGAFPAHAKRRGHGVAATYSSPSARSPASRPMILPFSARASGRSSRRARSAGSASTRGRAGGSSSTPSSGRRPTRSSSLRHHALAGGGEGAKGEHAHDRRHVHADAAHDRQPDRGIG